MNTQSTIVKVNAELYHLGFEFSGLEVIKIFDEHIIKDRSFLKALIFSFTDWIYLNVNFWVFNHRFVGVYINHYTYVCMLKNMNT